LAGTETVAAVVVEEDHATTVASLAISRRIAPTPKERPAIDATSLAILPAIAQRVVILEIPGAAITVAREVTSPGIALMPLLATGPPGESASTAAPTITGLEIALMAAGTVEVPSRCATLAMSLAISRGIAPRRTRPPHPRKATEQEAV
jgi:hypothetical protein